MEAKVAEVKMYGTDGQGARNSSFRVGDIEILVRPGGEERNERAFGLACELARSGASLAAKDEAIAEKDAEIDRLRDERDRARALVPPRSPIRLMGAGYVRFSGDEMWLFGKRERGFAEFGLRLQDWDHLFRTFNVRVAETGSDEHGQWWRVNNVVGA